MKSDSSTLIEYFNKQNSQYTVPLFQRPYVWEKEHWTKLWDDVVSYYDVVRENPANKPEKFMGAVVVLPENRNDGIYRGLIIDGQQRLTTLAVLLCAIRNCYPQKSEEIFGSFLVNRYRDPESDDYLKLIPTDGDRQVYEELVRNPKKVSKNHLLGKCYAFFKDNLTKTRDDDETYDIEIIYKIVTEVLKVAAIELNENDDPYAIFESLNASGKKLSVTDLIRNFVLMKFDGAETQREAYENYWLPIEKILEENNVNADDFFRKYISKNAKKKVNKEDVFKEIRNYFRPKSLDEIKIELRLMARDAQNYVTLMTAASGDLNPDGVLDIFKALDIPYIHVFTMQLCADLQDGKISLDDYKRCMRMLGAYYMRRAFRDGNTMTNTFVLVMLVRWLEDDERTADWLEALLTVQDAKASVWPDDYIFKQSIKENWEARKKEVKHFAARLKKEFGTTEEEFDNLSVKERIDYAQLLWPRPKNVPNFKNEATISDIWTALKPARLIVADEVIPVGSWRDAFQVLIAHAVNEIGEEFQENAAVRLPQVFCESPRECLIPYEVAPNCYVNLNRSAESFRKALIALADAFGLDFLKKIRFQVK